MTVPVIAHLTTVDLSLRYLLMPQLTAPVELGIGSVGISAPGEWVAEIEQAGVVHVALAGSTRGMNVIADLRSAVALWGILRRVRPDVLHTHNPKPGVYGRIVGRLAGVPIVVNTVHGLYATPEDRPAKRLVVYGLEALASRFSHAELCQSIEDLRLLRRYRLSPVDKLRHLGNGIDLARFGPAEDVRRDVRAELGYDDESIVVGIVGRLVAEKGYRELFEAFSRLDDRFELMCIGPPDPEKVDGLSTDEIAAAERQGVKFLGMRTDVDRLYKAMDVFVLPSHREGFPRSAMEAAATGVPVVATDIRGCREVVDDGVNGRLVPVGSATDLADAIGSVGGDPAVRAAMGEAGLRKARFDFDERRVVRRVLATYADVAERIGHDDLLSALRRITSEVTIRPAVAADAPFCALLHRRGIDTGFLSSLGQGFMTVLYRALIDDAAGVVLVAEDESGPIGFITGVTDTGAFYRRFVGRHGFEAALRAAPALVRPSALRKLVETARYGGEESAGPAAELLSMAVVSSRRGRGVAGRLQTELLARLTNLGAAGVKVVVGAENTSAISAYEKAGFASVGTIEVHAGDPSEVLVWQP